MTPVEPWDVGETSNLESDGCFYRPDMVKRVHSVTHLCGAGAEVEILLRPV